MQPAGWVLPAVNNNKKILDFFQMAKLFQIEKEVWDTLHLSLFAMYYVRKYNSIMSAVYCISLIIDFFPSHASDAQVHDAFLASLRVLPGLAESFFVSISQCNFHQVMHHQMNCAHNHGVLSFGLDLSFAGSHPAKGWRFMNSSRLIWRQAFS